MIIDNKCKIKITNRNKKYFKSKGYLCDNEYENVNPNDLSNGSNIKITVKCDYCDNIKNISVKNYNSVKSKNNDEYYCSKCWNKRLKKIMIDKYGVDIPLRNKKIQEKQKNTLYNNYGVYHPSESKLLKGNLKNILIDKYGVDNVSKIDTVKIKKIKSLKKSSLFRLKSKYNEIIDFDYDTKILKCVCINHNYNISYDLFYNRKELNTVICTICNPINKNISGLEIQLQDFIKDNYTNIILNDRHLGKELDIYVPDLKLAFEFNGLYWHNEINKENNYHLNKTELCEEQGIQLIHIYEDDWLYKQDIVKSVILNKLGKSVNKIYARKTEIREITDNKIVREFLNKNHLQGFIGGKVKLGLYYDNKLTSLMTFGKRRVVMGKKGSEEGEYELLRFCSKLNTNVVGGANKLFKHFVRNFQPKEITTYADMSWSNGNLYEQLGFEYQGKTKPNYYYIIDGIRHYRFNYRKDKLMKEGYSKEKTEKQIMLDRGIYRIYDSGNLKFIYNII